MRLMSNTCFTRALGEQGAHDAEHGTTGCREAVHDALRGKLRFDAHPAECVAEVTAGDQRPHANRR